MKKKLTLFKRHFLLAVIKYSKLEVISNDLRKLSVIIIPLGVIGIVASSTFTQISVIGSFALIFDGIFIYLISILLGATQKAKRKKIINRIIFTRFILLSKLHIIFLLILITVKLFL